jgi:hypothetical protein
VKPQACRAPLLKVLLTHLMCELHSSTLRKIDQVFGRPRQEVPKLIASTDAGRALIEFTEAPLLTRPFAALPGVPEDRVKALQTAFLAAHRDPQYLEESAKIGVYVSPVSATDIARSIERLSQASPELFEQLRRLLAGNKRGG